MPQGPAKGEMIEIAVKILTPKDVQNECAEWAGHV
jgi:hypothetical protein